jgi:hypothetical protein
LEGRGKTREARESEKWIHAERANILFGASPKQPQNIDKADFFSAVKNFMKLATFSTFSPVIYRRIRY